MEQVGRREEELGESREEEKSESESESVCGGRKGGEALGRTLEEYKEQKLLETNNRSYKGRGRGRREKGGGRRESLQIIHHKDNN